MILKFKPSEEAMDKLWRDTIRMSPRFSDNKLELLLMTMDTFEKKGDYTRYDTPIFTIKCKLMSIISDAKDEIKRRIYQEWKESKDKTFTISLYDSDLEYEECENLKNINYKDTIDEVEGKLDYYIETLAILHTIVPSGDYFNKDDNFSEKQSEIKGIIDDFYWEAHNMAVNEIVETYKEFIVCGCDEEESDEEE